MSCIEFLSYLFGRQSQVPAHFCLSGDFDVLAGFKISPLKGS